MKSTKPPTVPVWPDTRFRKHGMWLSPEFRVWSRMLERCTNPRHRAYPRYGGRGITVCDRWRGDFAAFYADMGPRPGPRQTLERIDNDSGYSPENCRWATYTDQARNQCRNRRLTWHGETLCLAEWAERIGISPDALRGRLTNGWDLERALTTPLDTTKSHRRK